MECPNCGEEISEGDSACPNCGALIEEPCHDIMSWQMKRLRKMLKVYGVYQKPYPYPIANFSTKLDSWSTRKNTARILAGGNFVHQ